MQVLMIVFNQTGRGTYYRAFSLGRVLARKGHTVTLLSTSPSARASIQEWDEGQVHIVEAPDLFSGSLRSGWDPWNTLRRRRWLLDKRFDIVHAFESRPVVIYPALAAQRQGAKLVIDWCDWFGKGGSVEERPNPLVRAVLRPVETYYEEHFRGRADGTTVINTALKERALSLGLPEGSIFLIRNGSDTSREPVDVNTARQRLNLPLKIPIIGFVGGTYTQDAGLMSAAFNRVLNSLPEARLLLVGTFNRPIEKWIRKPEAILRTGKVDFDRLFLYLSACDLCWLPLADSGANRGRWPLKLNDYMMVGRPVVATAVGDLPQVITDYRLGLVTCDHPVYFADQTLTLLQDEEARADFGHAARQAAEEVFNWELLGSQLEAYYQRIISRSAYGIRLGAAAVR